MRNIYRKQSYRGNWDKLVSRDHFFFYSDGKGQNNFHRTPNHFWKIKFEVLGFAKVTNNTRSLPKNKSIRVRYKLYIFQNLTLCANISCYIRNKFRLTEDYWRFCHPSTTFLNLNPPWKKPYSHAFYNFRTSYFARCSFFHAFLAVSTSIFGEKNRCIF